MPFHKTTSVDVTKSWVNDDLNQPDQNAHGAIDRYCSFIDPRYHQRNDTLEPVKEGPILSLLFELAKLAEFLVTLI